MELSKEQINKIFELADKTFEKDINEVTEVDISRALIEIERKLNFFNVDVNFKAENKNVLIVDDLELSLYHLNQLMKKVGVRTFVARNKEDAKAEMLRHSFDYLFLDLFLPDSDDGFDLIKDAVELKKNGTQHYKIIVISGSDDKAMIDKCYELGVDGYVTKSENWHTDILKYINTPSSQNENGLFQKEILNDKIISYTFRRFNDNKIFDALLADINSAVLEGTVHIALNLEKVAVFDPDNTYIFAEIYKICTNAGGLLLLIHPSEKIQNALSSAFLEGVIPVLHSTEKVIDYVNEVNG